MTPERIEALLAASRPEPAPPEPRRRILEAVRARTRPAPPRTLWTGRLAVTTAALLLLGTLAWLLGDPKTPASQEPRSFEEKRLDTLPPETSVEGPLVWSADGRHWGVVIREGSGMRAVVDGRKGDKAQRVSALRLGAGGRFAYLASPFVTDPSGRIVIRPDSTLILDGAEKTDYERYAHPTWSPDGRTLAFVGSKDRKWRVVVGDAAGEAFDGVDALTWSPDGKTVAYAARIHEDRFVVLGDQKKEIFDNVECLTFSPDGKTLAYLAGEGDAHMIVGDRKSGAFTGGEPPVFSGDSSSVGWIATRDARPFLVLGEKWTALDHQASGLALSHDGRVCAFAQNDPSGHSWVTLGRRSGETWDLRKQDPYNGVAQLHLSPDGRRLVYVARKGNREYLAVDGQLTKKFSRIERLRLGPDGTPAYVATAYGTSFVMAGEARGEEVDAVLDGPVFSVDGRKVVYIARKGAELWSKTLDVK